MPAGHRTLPHPADVIIEAWAPTVEQCIAEAVQAMVDGFADLTCARPTAERHFRVESKDPAEQLVEVLDEVIYRMDTTGELPRAVRVERHHEPDRSEPDRSEPDRSEPDRSEPDRSEPDRSEADRSEADGGSPEGGEANVATPDRGEANVLAANGTGVEVHLSMADTSQATAVGAVPKAVSLHELRFGCADGIWRCTVTLDV